MMRYAPVVVFAYKRKDKLQECLKALEKNILVGETDLIIFCDGKKGTEDEEDVNNVKEYLLDYKRHCKFKGIRVEVRKKNIGLANSIISGVTEVINMYGKVIVVEDDLITTPDFLEYMNDALNFYENSKEYGSISAFTYPIKGLLRYKKDIYVTRKGECWGWGTWKDRWNAVDWDIKDYEQYLIDKKLRKKFESLQCGIDKMLQKQMNGEIDSWAVRWCYNLFKMNMLTVYPSISKVKNMGFDGTGTHCEKKKELHMEVLDDNNKICKFERLSVSEVLEKQVAVYERGTVIERIMYILQEWMR